MLHFLPPFLIGVISFLLISLNVLAWSAIILPTALLKVLLPVAKIKKGLSWLLTVYATGWIYCNSFLFKVFHKTTFDARGLDSLNPDDSYLLLCNHCSWIDVFTLQHVFKGRVPFMKFFLKRELIWLPIFGQVWWAMDYPFMKRYSRAFLKKHPELQGKDMEATRKFCRKLKNTPISIINFLEGTRFNFEKRRQQNSPYRHLLKPKAGGISVALSTMGDYLSKALDVTIVYPENKPPLGFWTFLKGGVPSITVRVKSFDIPDYFAGRDYQKDKTFRKDIQEWVNRLWEEKDKLIEDILEEYPALPKNSAASN